MKRTNSSGGRRQYYGRYLAHYTKKNSVVLILGLLFLAGVFLGALFVRSVSETTMEALLRILGNFSQRRREQAFSENFTSSLTSSLNYLLVLFVCGFCAIAQPLEIALLMLRGLGFGFSAATLYAQYGAGATGFVGVFLVPGMVLTTVALLLCCQESLRMSGSLWGILRGGDAQPYSRRIYCARYIAAVVFCCAAAALEALLYALFSGAFLLG